MRRKHASTSTPRKNDTDKGQVRDQDGVPQGASGQDTWTGQRNTPKAPGAYSAGQGAHHYSYDRKESPAPQATAQTARIKRPASMTTAQFPREAAV